MSLYTHSFQYLPPPPRSAFSWGAESTRAKLPDFVDVNELQEFVLRLFIYRFQVTHITLQILVGVACLGFLIVISALIIARRMYERNFWIFRLAKTPSGTIMVPNTMLSFIVIESGFVVVLIAFLSEIKDYYSSDPNQVKNIILWILLPWCILIFGPFFAALGTHYATPRTMESLTVERNSGTKRWLKSFLSNAILANILAIVIPSLTCITVAVPAFVANASYMRAKEHQEQWLRQYQNATQFTQEMVTGAQMVWYETLPSLRLTCITLCIWFFWAIFCFFLYTTLSLRLIRAIYKEVKKTKREEMLFIATRTQNSPSQDQRKSKKAITQTQKNPENETIQQNSGESIEMNIRPAFRLPGIREEQEQGNPYQIRSIDTMQYDLQSALNLDAFELSRRESLQVPSDANARTTYPKSPQEKARSTSRSSFIIDSTASGSESKYMKIRMPHLVITQRKLDKRRKESMIASIDEQKRELKRAAFNILAQCLAISPGCALMGGIALMLALTIYGGFEQPSQDRTGTYFERFTGIAILFVIYTIITFGSVCFLCVFFRVYEPIFVKSGHSSRDTESRETMIDRNPEEES
ncbi:uncharacterized protein FA14DRAFT_183519 [Meira miltonrushii]|uniref:Uncharacterized protein n=1 Tax=Meira miltonrushii TaxID=1280837 RepID=A0A316VQ22_9BASI|nr:uncharacterized protein FA14DRAFT_183519 [Meira miltonrushii]PWN37575.1 hypothetical protein FA14DRAFT_183519 [Meira miltonrushii]